jgi:hypothetical protein
VQTVIRSQADITERWQEQVRRTFDKFHICNVFNYCLVCREL